MSTGAPARDPVALAQSRAAVSAGRPPEDEPTTPGYAGLVTRGVAFAIDALTINVVSVATAGVVGLAVSLFQLPSQVSDILKAVGAVVYLLWAAGYFVVFWSSTGQTLGDRVMRIRVVAFPGGGRIPPRRAAVRTVAMVLGAIPFFLGYVGIVTRENRRAFHDKAARTAVVYVTHKDEIAGPGSTGPVAPRP